MAFSWPKLRPESEDFLHLDALRIIASVGVVAYHWSAWLSLPSDWTGSGGRLEGLTYFVDLFFVISGFIICHVYADRMHGRADFAAFLRKRIARLGPLHWATLLFVAASGLTATLIGVQLHHAEAYNPQCFVPNALFAHAFGVCNYLSFNFPSWSISAEFGCYLLFPLFLALYRLRVWLPAAASFALITFLTLAGPLGPEQQAWHELTYYWGVLRALPAFGLGVTLYAIKDKLHIPCAGEAMFALLAAFIALGALAAPGMLSLTFAYLIVVCGIAADQARASGPITRALAPWGALTYSVYMLHVPLGSALFSLLGRSVFELAPAAMNVAVVAGLPVLFALSYVSYFLFETPARRWISGRARPSDARPSVFAALLLRWTH